MTPIQKDLNSSIEIVKAVADTIKELGEVPSGHLYARLMGHMSLSCYDSIIQLLKNAGLVSENDFLLKWEGPK